MLAVETKLIEINANELFEGDHNVNRDFCESRCRASAKDGSMYIMDGTNYSEQVEEAVKAGCTPAFVAVYREAVDVQHAGLVMFHQDV